MSTIEVYTFENAKGETAGSYSTTDSHEAKEHGEKYGLKVIANQYSYDDSELVWDFTDIADIDEEE